MRCDVPVTSKSVAPVASSRINFCFEKSRTASTSCATVEAFLTTPLILFPLVHWCSERRHRYLFYCMFRRILTLSFFFCRLCFPTLASPSYPEIGFVNLFLFFSFQVLKLFWAILSAVLNLHRKVFTSCVSSRE